MNGLSLSIAPGDDPVPAFECLSQALIEPGYGIFPAALDAETCRNLVKFLEELDASDQLRRAGIGKGGSQAINSEIRSDSIHWLNPNRGSDLTNQWLHWTDQWRQYLRRALFLPLEHYEGHLARYPAGGFYKPHLDQHRQTPHRQITLILYLNEDWRPDDGGQLRLFTDPEQGLNGPSIEVLPKLGTLAIFRSADFWHEVLPARRPRYSLTGWMRDDLATPIELG